MKGGLIKDNTARGTGSNLALYDRLTAGGGVFIWGNASTMVMTGGTIQGNKALGYNGVGGGVFVGAGTNPLFSIQSNTGSLPAQEPLITGNEAGYAGGGIALGSNIAASDAPNAYFTLNNAAAVIEDNTATLYGGGLFSVSNKTGTTDKSFKFLEGTFQNNSVSGTGTGHTVFIRQNTITADTAITLLDGTTGTTPGFLYHTFSGDSSNATFTLPPPP
jgi:hypothetical protein